MRKTASKEDQKHSPSSGDKSEVLGPPLPPGFKQSKESDDEEGTYGPSLPPGFKKPEDSEEEDCFGPPLPPGHIREEVSSEEEGEIIGPLPPSSSDMKNVKTVAEQFEERATKMKDRLQGKDESSAPKRETWMTELPDNYKSFGLGPRSFRKNALPENDDRSVWTDTPADQERKLRERLLAKTQGKDKKPQAEPKLSERDRMIADQVDAYNQSERNQSLMDMHTSSRKRKAEEANEKKERRPFDREIDLQVNRFDEAQRKNLIKKSAKLDSRFAHSKDKVFL